MEQNMLPRSEMESPRKLRMLFLTPAVLWFRGSPIQDGHPQTPLFGCWLLLQLCALKDVEKENKNNFHLLLDRNIRPPHS